MPAPFDDAWIAAALALDLPVVRGGDGYVHFDGRTLHLSTDEHLDHDDTVGQLVFHELCHALVQGPAHRHAVDWGLDNTTDRDEVRELAAIRLQAHLAGAWSLRPVLFPTTVWRASFEQLGDDAFALGSDGNGARDAESARLARDAACRAAERPFAAALRQALATTAALAGLPLHPKSGHPLRPAASPDRRCGGCGFRAASGLCRQAPRRAFVGPGDAACARFEPTPDCLGCGACCRSAYDLVEVSPRDPVVLLHPERLLRREGRWEVRREGDRCGCLDGPEGGPFHCVIYDDRPRTCRDFTLGSRHCLDARRKVGLSL